MVYYRCCTPACFTSDTYGDLKLRRRCRQLNMAVNTMTYYLVFPASHNPSGSFNAQPGIGREAEGGAALASGSLSVLFYCTFASKNTLSIMGRFKKTQTRSFMVSTGAFQKK